jgi:hypothetical protein
LQSFCHFKKTVLSLPKATPGCRRHSGSDFFVLSKMIFELAKPPLARPIKSCNFVRKNLTKLSSFRVGFASIGKTNQKRSQK